MVEINPVVVIPDTCTVYPRLDAWVYTSNVSSPMATWGILPNVTKNGWSWVLVSVVLMPMGVRMALCSPVFMPVWINGKLAVYENWHRHMREKASKITIIFITRYLNDYSITY